MKTNFRPQAHSPGDCREFGYEADERWAALPQSWTRPEVAATVWRRELSCLVARSADPSAAIFAAKGR